MNCQNCGRYIDESLFPQNLVFCPYCGQNLRSASENEEEETARLSFCPYCGLELSEQTTCCPHCGKKLKAGEKRSSGQKAGKAFLGQGKIFLEQLERSVKLIARAIRNVFSSGKKTQKLFQQWSEYAELSPDEVPSLETLREMAEAGRAKHSPRRHLVAGTASLIAIAVIILLIIQC